jgi:hypothetical protein
VRLLLFSHGVQDHVARLEEAAAHRKRVAKIRKSQLHGSSSSSSSSSVDASDGTADDDIDDDDLFDEDSDDAYDSDSEHNDADSSSSSSSSGDSKGFDVEQYLKGILWNVQVGTIKYQHLLTMTILLQVPLHSVKSLPCVYFLLAVVYMTAPTGCACQEDLLAVIIANLRLLVVV